MCVCVCVCVCVCRSLNDIKDREICCYSISCKERENIGEPISVHHSPPQLLSHTCIQQVQSHCHTDLWLQCLNPNNFYRKCYTLWKCWSVMHAASIIEGCMVEVYIEPIPHQVHHEECTCSTLYCLYRKLGWKCHALSWDSHIEYGGIRGDVGRGEAPW